MPAIDIAVVIPTLDEEQALREHLPAVVETADEVVISDGGSADGTLRVASELDVRVVSGARGRGPQMNRGARATTARVLVFLHADTRLPPDAMPAIRHQVRRGRVGGGFQLLFDDDRFLFRVGSQLVNLRTRLTGAPLGDQAQWVTRTAFEELGGFRDWPILEDLDLIRRLKRRGDLGLIRMPVITSARRYAKGGILKTLANNWWIWCRYFLGASPVSLGRRYRDIR